mgnify:CR=1 FL=1
MNSSPGLKLVASLSAEAEPILKSLGYDKGSVGERMRGLADDPRYQFAEGDAEKALFNALDVAEAAIGPAIKAEDFAAAMGAMAQLRAPIDAFFTAVQVNSDNGVVRRNRLNLLHRFSLWDLPSLSPRLLLSFP